MPIAHISKNVFLEIKMIQSKVQLFGRCDFSTTADNRRRTIRNYRRTFKMCLVARASLRVRVKVHRSSHNWRRWFECWKRRRSFGRRPAHLLSRRFAVDAFAGFKSWNFGKIIGFISLYVFEFINLVIWNFCDFKNAELVYSLNYQIIGFIG